MGPIRQKRGKVLADWLPSQRKRDHCFMVPLFISEVLYQSEFQQETWHFPTRLFLQGLRKGLSTKLGEKWREITRDSAAPWCL